MLSASRTFAKVRIYSRLPRHTRDVLSSVVQRPTVAESVLGYSRDVVVSLVRRHNIGVHLSLASPSSQRRCFVVPFECCHFCFASFVQRHVVGVRFSYPSSRPRRLYTFARVPPLFRVELRAERPFAHRILFHRSRKYYCREPAPRVCRSPMVVCRRRGFPTIENRVYRSPRRCPWRTVVEKQKKAGQK